MTRTEYVNKYEQMATKNMAELELISPHDDHTRFVLKKPGTMFYYTELVPISGGLLIFGDIETSMFRYCSNKTGIGKLKWLSGSGYSYMAEKFTTGMNDGGKLRVDYDHAVCLHDIEEMFERHLKENEGSCEDDIQDIFVEAKAKLNEYGPEQAELVLIRDYDFEVTAGRVPAMRLLYAKAAIRRVLELLEHVDAQQTTLI